MRTDAPQSSDGGHIFLGKEEPAKDVECILIWNEEDDVRFFRFLFTITQPIARWTVDLYSGET